MGDRATTHVCQDADCLFWGKPSTRSCRCHMTAEQMSAENTDRLIVAGKHLAVKLADCYRAASINPGECQAIADWMLAVGKAEGRL